VLVLTQPWWAKIRESDMAQKFFGTIFRRRKPVIPMPKMTISDFKPIKPAKDIADFQYPPESSFYAEEIDRAGKD
jgi:hypothetical protein